MPKLVESNSCCGCAACANICGKGAIAMKPNIEGFLHPEIDYSLCVECGLCEKTCPGLNPAMNSEANFSPKVYIIQHKDNTIRYQSTSGGAFTAIAEEVIHENGIVFGAFMTEDLKVRHGYVETEERLALFRNSKYVQSEVRDSYKTAKKFLSNGRVVCYSGTPCQINGLYKYLGKDFDNLIAVDVVCKSVPSPLVFDKYVEFKKHRENQISDIVFRDKKRGFLYCTMAHYRSHEERSASNAQYRRGSESDEWLRLFLSGQISRRACMACRYQTPQRVSDFTLGDIWETGNPSLDDNKGSTLVHVWTKKGQKFLDKIKDNIRCVDYPIEKQDVERKQIQVASNREKLFKDVQTLTPEAFFRKYVPYNAKVRTKKITRYILWRLNLQEFVRRIKHSFIHRVKK